MRASSFPPFSCHRRGFTLLELMLVLAIIVIVTAVTIPSISRAFKNQSLVKAGDLVRDEFAQARIKAMESGMTYEFVYVVGGNTFQVNPRASSQDSIEMSVDAANDNATGASGNVANPFATTPQMMADQTSGNVGGIVAQNTLVDGVRFSGGDLEVDARAMSMDGTMQSAIGTSPTTSVIGGGETSTPIFFYPDGTTSNAQLILGNERGRYVVLRLRGLTGMCKLSDLLLAEELPQ